MGLPIICPGCFLKFPVESGITHAAAHEAIARAVKLPAPLGSAIIRYIGLFAPTKRAINMDKLARLLDELQIEIDKGKIKYQGRMYTATLEVWRFTLEDMVAKQGKWTLPLKTHGLLYDIVGQNAAKDSARIEDQTEKQRRTRTTTNKTDEEVRAVSEITADIKHFEKLLEGMSDEPTKSSTLKTIDTLKTELEQNYE